MDKQRKAQIKRYIAWGCLALLVAVLAVMPLIATENAEEDGPQASILTTTAQTRTIDTQLIGGGQLSGETSESITIPAAIKLEEYLVSNGDDVKAGDPIARVDKVSVLVALEQVQETLDYLSEEIADAANDTASNRVTAQAGGRVKIVYAEKGDSVRDVMLEHGALAVLSLDGRMAVDIQRETGLAVGTTVTVKRADGTTVDGRVESSHGGVLTVSVADKDYPIGETVTLVAGDGTQLGQGELYIHNPWNATAYYGTITTVQAREGATVAAGSILFRLESSEHTPEFQLLSTQRQEYEELMQELFTLYKSGVVTAPCDGFVTGVDTKGSFMLSDTGEQGWFLQLLSSENPEDSSDPPPSPSDPTDPSDPADPSDPTDPSGPTDPSEPTTPSEPVDPQDGAYKVLVGQVTASAEGTLILRAYPATISCDSLGEVTINTGLMTASIARNISGAAIVKTDLSTPHTEPINTGDILYFVTENATGATFVAWAGNQPVPGSGSNIPGGGGMPGFGGMMGYYSGAVPQQPFQLYSLNTLPIATVTSRENMTLEITIDEQDIASLRTGMEATVTVEALTGQTFPATITKISNTGINGGGSTKFTVRLTLDTAGNMLPGMHASAYLTLNTAEAALTVPVAALVQQGTKTVLYTSYDEKEELLGNPVTVTTGASDGEYVEILSGLENGTTIYYAYYDTLDISNIPDQGPFGF